MPAWIQDHEVWARAKARAKEQYPDLEDGDRLYAIVTSIYKKMHGRIGTGKAVILLKAHIKGYTKKDGTFVKPHEDKRPQPAQQKSPSLSELVDAALRSAGKDPDAPPDPAKALRLKADRLTGEAMQMLERIPPGQPVHSARDRALREKSMAKQRQAAELLTEAENLEQGARQKEEAVHEPPPYESDYVSSGVRSAINPGQLRHAEDSGWIKKISPKEAQALHGTLVYDRFTGQPTDAVMRRYPTENKDNGQWYQILGNDYHPTPYPKIIRPARGTPSPRELARLRSQPTLPFAAEEQRGYADNEGFEKNRWGSAKLGKKVEWVKRGKWITNKGGLSATGERIAGTPWEELSPAAKRIISREIAKDYGRKPSRIPLLPGDKFTTVSGRITSPFPKYSPHPSKAQSTKDERALHVWLKNEAIAESQARDDEFNLLQFQALDPKNWSMADGDAVNQYVFGRPEGDIGDLSVDQPARFEGIPSQAERAQAQYAGWKGFPKKEAAPKLAPPLSYKPEQLSLFKSATKRVLLFLKGQRPLFGEPFPIKRRRARILKKAHVKTYQRSTKSGGMVTVKEHEDSRQSARAYQRHPRRKRGESEGEERGQVRQEEQSSQRSDDLHTQQPAFKPTPPAQSEEEVGAWLDAVMQEPDIQQAMKEVSEGTPTDHLYKQADGSYAPERAKIHEAIIASMLNPKAVPTEGQKPHAVILLGPPGAGKTTTLAPVAQELGVEFTTINADDVKAKLPEYNGRNAGIVHEESSDIAEGQLFPRALKDRHHMVIDITGSNGKKVKDIVGQFYNAGYEVSIMYAHLPAHKAAARVVDRFRGSGRFVPPSYVINKVDGNPEQTYNELKRDPRVSHYRRYNNDVEKGSPAPLQEEGSSQDRLNLPVPGQFTKGVSSTSRSPFRSDGRAAYGQHARGLSSDAIHPLLQRAHRFHAHLTKALIYLDDDLSSPDLDPASRGVLRAERLKTIERLQALHAATEGLHVTW